MFLKHKKWFTLIEMLIVIVIIGILAAALIPRLMSARGRANDTARKADLSQLGTAIISYQVDNGKFPDTPGSIDTIKTQLTKWWMASFPMDPDRTSTFSGVQVNTGTPGQYMYTPIFKNGFENGGFIIMSKTETENGSNFVFCGEDSLPNQFEIRTTTDFDTISLCTTFIADATCTVPTTGNTNCHYTKSKGQLRYIYRY